jgi:hypothetical protein
VIVALLFLAVSGSVVYWAVAKYDLGDLDEDAVDSQHYIAIYQGKGPEEIAPEMRCRVLTPWLARLVPDLPEWIVQSFSDTNERRVNLKFGIVNMGWLWLTGITLFYFLRDLSFTSVESLLGGFLFYTSFFVITYGGLPLVDAGAYFFLIAGLRSLQTGSVIGYSSALIAGMAAKETTILVFGAAVLLNPRDWRFYAVAGPVLGAYVFCRGQLSFAADPSLFDRSIATRFSLYGLIEFTQAFLFLWILSIYGWVKCETPPLLRRLAPLALLPLVAVLVLGTDVGRILFLSFWFVIPLSLLALRRLFPEGTTVTS